MVTVKHRLSEAAVGWIVGILTFLFLTFFVPELTCVDGWRSPSIGRQGACSYHGGVEKHSVLGVLIGASVAAGFVTFNVLSRKRQRKKSRSRFAIEDASSAEIRLIRSAIENNKKIQFLYKRAGEAVYQMRIPTQIDTHSVCKSAPVPTQIGTLFGVG
jgi:hypothetical protein